jgi:hypothetical protein
MATAWYRVQTVMARVAVGGLVETGHRDLYVVEEDLRTARSVAQRWNCVPSESAAAAWPTSRSCAAFASRAHCPWPSAPCDAGCAESSRRRRPPRP